MTGAEHDALKDLRRAIAALEARIRRLEFIAVAIAASTGADIAARLIG